MTNNLEGTVSHGKLVARLQKICDAAKEKGRTGTMDEEFYGTLTGIFNIYKGFPQRTESDSGSRGSYGDLSTIDEFVSEYNTLAEQGGSDSIRKMFVDGNVYKTTTIGGSNSGTLGSTKQRSYRVGKKVDDVRRMREVFYAFVDGENTSHLIPGPAIEPAQYFALADFFEFGDPLLTVSIKQGGGVGKRRITKIVSLPKTEKQGDSHVLIEKGRVEVAKQ